MSAAIPLKSLIEFVTFSAARRSAVAICYGYSVRPTITLVYC